MLIAAMAAGAASVKAAESRDPGVSVRDIYTLGSGDRVKVTVYGEKDLSGTFEISGAGMIAFPLIGQVEAGGATVRALEKKIAARLLDGYLKQPRVNVEVATYRPFYIIGEVKRPGSYAYVEGMTVVNAVALGGGFTYRAREKRLFVRRIGDPPDQERPVTPEDPVYPGDVIRVPERFF